MRSRVGLWLRTRDRYKVDREHPDTGREEKLIDGWVAYRYSGPRKWSPLTPGPPLIQLAADAEHSALLERLLLGREPLPELPFIQDAYPVYPDE